MNESEGTHRSRNMGPIISREHRLAMNAAGEVLMELGIRASVSYDPNFIGNGPYFSLTAKVPSTDQYASGSSDTLAGALEQFLIRAAEITANPPPQICHTADEAKRYAIGVVEEFRKAATSPSVLDDVADRLAAIPVKEL